MKKSLLITIIFLVSILGIGGVFILRGRKAQPRTAFPSRPTEAQIAEVALEDKPHVALVPRADGREFTMEINNIKDATTVEYELVYLSQGLSRGVVGSVDLKGEERISRKLLLGSCSRNVCKYDEGIEEGTLTLRLRGSGGVRKFTADFHLQRGGKELTSTDGKFKLGGEFPVGIYYLTMSIIGLPERLAEGKIVGGPYGVFTSGSKTIKKGKVSIEVSESKAIEMIEFWDKNNPLYDQTHWRPLSKDFQSDEKTFSASADTAGAFIAVILSPE